MIVRVSDGIMDFDGDIHVESQIKLFEEIETSNGDYSFSFELPRTDHNLTLLGLPFPDTVKTIYQDIECDILDNEGIKVFTGSLKVEKITKSTIEATFFAGNTQWFKLLNEPMYNLPLSEFDVDLDVTNVQASWTADEGLVFPILDTGVLITRSSKNIKIEDFTGCFYVKTLFNKIFATKGIKIQGELLSDSTFDKLLVASNTKSQDEVSSRTCFVNKTTTTTIGVFDTYEPITFQDTSTFPYFDGSLGNFGTTAYTADVKMRVEIDININYTNNQIGNGILARVNATDTVKFFDISSSGGNEILSKKFQIDLNAGDYVQIVLYQSLVATLSAFANSTIRVTPVYVYKAFGKSSVPKWSQADFVSNIFRLFNVLPHYNTETKTLTMNLFSKILEKTPIDISDKIEINETDYSEFVSSYGKKNNFIYQESDDEDLREYNIYNFIKYGNAVLEIENDFLESDQDILESEFTAPITYLNGVFDLSLEKINYVELEDIEDGAITSVSNSGGTPRFNISNADDIFSEGDVVGIETDIDTYNGEWVVITVTSTYIVVNELDYVSSATGTATLLRHKFTTDDNVYLFVNINNTSLSKMSSNTSMYITDLSLIFETTSFTSASLAYFNLLSNGKEINKKYKQSLSFGDTSNELSYQKTILDTYWRNFETILNDPVMLRCTGHFDRVTYESIKTFLYPVMVKTNETSNIYYINRIGGYSGSHIPCEIELIKL